MGKRRIACRSSNSLTEYEGKLMFNLSDVDSVDVDIRWDRMSLCRSHCLLSTQDSVPTRVIYMLSFLH